MTTVGPKYNSRAPESLRICALPFGPQERLERSHILYVFSRRPDLASLRNRKGDTTLDPLEAFATESSCFRSVGMTRNSGSSVACGHKEVLTVRLVDVPGPPTDAD